MRRVPWWVWTLLGVAVVVGGVAAAGGFADAPISRVPTIAVGSTFHGQQVDSRVLGARLTTGDGGASLELDLESTDRADAPVPIDAISLRVIAGDVLDGSTAPDRIVLVRDGEGADELQPGVRTRLALRWSVPDGALASGDRVVAGLFQSVPETGDTVLLDSYAAPTVQARLELRIA